MKDSTLGSLDLQGSTGGYYCSLLLLAVLYLSGSHYVSNKIKDNTIIFDLTMLFRR